MSETNFNAKAVANEARKAILAAVDETTEAAAKEASSKHWWQSHHGRHGLKGQVKTEPARVKRGKVIGSFGSTQRSTGFYGLILERRRPWLRPVADRIYPTVNKRISRRLG